MKLGSTVNQFGDDRPALVHWIPTSALGGLEVALLTFLREAPELEHTIVTGEASGPMADLWRASGAKIIETPEWWEFLGISWASRWSGFVNSRPLSRLIIWSPTRLNLILRPLSPEIRCVVHLGSVGAFGFKARLFERMSALFNQSGCRPLLIACSVAAKKTAADEPILADYDCVVGYNAARPEYFALGSARQQQGGSAECGEWSPEWMKAKDNRYFLRLGRFFLGNSVYDFALVGGGPREALLRQEAHELGLGGIVEFAGAVPDPSVIMRDWDAFVFATEAGEGFGIAVAEAMAAGLPCVVTDVPALREMAEDAAHYVRPHSAAVLAEAIMSVFKDPDLAADLSRKAKSRAEAQFTPSAFSNAYKEALGLLRT